MNFPTLCRRLPACLIVSAVFLGLPPIGVAAEKPALTFVLGARSIEGPNAIAQSAIATETTRHLHARNYKALESQYRKLRQAKRRTPDGAWEQAVFYNQLMVHPRRVRDPAHFADMLRQAGAWRKQFPQSVPGRLFEVYVHMSRVYAYRGTTLFNDMPEADKAVVSQGSNEAMAALHDARRMAMLARDPEWFRALLEVMPYSGGFRARTMTNVFNEAIAKYPDYHPTYFAAAFYADPRWHGAPGVVDEIARNAGKGAFDEQPSMYARVYWHLDKQLYDGKIFEVTHAEWPAMRISFEHLVAQYPDPSNLNAYAYYACKAGDYAVMNEVLRRPAFKRVLMDNWGTGDESHAACSAHTEADPQFETKQAAARIRRLTRIYYEFIRHGISMRDEARLDESLEALHKAEDLNREIWGSSAMMTQYHLGWTFFDMGKFDEAISAFTEGLKAQPDYAWAFWRRGRAYEALGRREEARRDFQAGAGHLKRHLSDTVKPGNANEARMLQQMQDKFRQYESNGAAP